MKHRIKSPEVLADKRVKVQHAQADGSFKEKTSLVLRINGSDNLHIEDVTTPITLFRDGKPWYIIESMDVDKDGKPECVSWRGIKGGCEISFAPELNLQFLIPKDIAEQIKAAKTEQLDTLANTLPSQYPVYGEGIIKMINFRKTSMEAQL